LTPPACTLAAAVAHRGTPRHAIFEVQPPRGARAPIDNAVLDVRTTRRLGRLLWRPLLSDLWSRRARL
jgi:hypothetical protein